MMRPRRTRPVDERGGAHWGEQAPPQQYPIGGNHWHCLSDSRLTALVYRKLASAQRAIAERFMIAAPTLRG